MPNIKPMRSFRCDDELYLKVKFLAQEEDRSVNNYIVLSLKRIVSDYEAQNGTISVDVDKLYE